LRAGSSISSFLCSAGSPGRSASSCCPSRSIWPGKITIAAAGARWFASSVHVHATYDTDDKASGAVAYLARAFGEDPGAVTGARWAFVGDSGNDAACFSAFRTTFAVANVRSHLARIPVTPRYVARGEMGEGFAEIARAIVASRTA